ncbi:MAG: transaldolase, partial [Rudaea sp.]
MTTNPLVLLQEQGQSVWLDSIRRGHIRSGALQKLIDEDGIRGETSNPTIFEKAITGSRDYADDIAVLAAEGKNATEIYERLATDDVRMAADVFSPLYESTQAADGYISIEVSPHLAFDTAGTIAEARRLFKIVGRPNLMIKIPATPEGIPAIEQCLYEGMNVNVTLLFAVAAYEQVAWAFIRGVERRAAEGLPLGRIASVASFFVSRIDTLADQLLEEKAKAETDPARAARVLALRGELAIANARVAYAKFGEVFGSERFIRLAARGAHVQRPLWASTSTKNPHYRDVVYVEELIGPDTVNTLPADTVEAFRDHGCVARTVDADLSGAHRTIEEFESFGLTLDAVTSQVL